MNTLKKVTGTWSGAYSYDSVEQNSQVVPVTFTLMLKQGWFGRFTGKVIDGPGGMPDTGSVVGSFSFPRIDFTKKMPVCYVATPDGRVVSLRQFLIEQGQTCERDIPHSPIIYEGKFLSPVRAEGTWIIRANHVFLDYSRVLQLPGARGSWSIDAS